MAKSVIKIMCWKRSHVNELVMTRSQEQKLESDIPKLKKVCPVCKPENCAITIVEGTTVFVQGKNYTCSNGHLSVVRIMDNMMNVTYGPNSSDFFNFECDISELADVIDGGEIACNHTEDGKLCCAKLTPVDDFQLSRIKVPAVKTKTRIGDLWDRQGIEPVRPGNYDADGKYSDSKTEVANKRRLARMQRDRNVSVDRLPGDVMRNPSNKNYGRKDKNSLKPDRLK